MKIKTIFNLYLTNIKHLTGNILSDNELVSLTSLDKSSFLTKIKDVFNNKKKDRIKIIGQDENNDIEKKIFLQIIDFSWRSHLQYLEQLRQVIGLRSYGQKDPLSEFKKEAFLLFENLLEKVKVDLIKFLFNLNVIVSKNKEEKSEEKIDTPKNKLKNQKIGRNEKCPCGSGKKFKHCCAMI